MKYERLTKRISNNEVIHNCGKCPKVDVANYCSEANCATVILDRLAELEDKIESGKMLELPCKVGDILYAIMDVNYKMQLVKFRATNIELGTDGEIYFNTPTCYSRKLTFGKSVFADKSQAKARLKELQGE